MAIKAKGPLFVNNAMPHLIQFTGLTFRAIVSRHDIVKVTTCILVQKFLPFITGFINKTKKNHKLMENEGLFIFGSDQATHILNLLGVNVLSVNDPASLSTKTSANKLPKNILIDFLYVAF